jgi:uncharacterized protein (DUF2147 family)
MRTGGTTARSGRSTTTSKIWKVDDDKVYDSEMKLRDNGALKVSGCILGGLICKGQEWTPVE